MASKRTSTSTKSFYINETKRMDRQLKFEVHNVMQTKFLPKCIALIITGYLQDMYDDEMGVIRNVLIEKEKVWADISYCFMCVPKIQTIAYTGIGVFRGRSIHCECGIKNVATWCKCATDYKRIFNVVRVLNNVHKNVIGDPSTENEEESEDDYDFDDSSVRRFGQTSLRPRAKIVSRSPSLEF